MTKVMISAGELSGDIHAGAIACELKKINPNIEIFGMGGEELRAAGGEVLFDIKEYSVMGFIEVIKNLFKIIKLKNDFGKEMINRRPDCFVTVDYPGLNMRLAKMAHDLKIPVLMYIPPSAWAWHKSRAKKVAQIADKVAAIFPFEYDVYNEAGANTEFVGHPLLDIVKPSMDKNSACNFFGKREGHPLVAIMPGSRKMEIEKMLPTFLDAAKILHKRHPEIDFVLPKAETIERSALEKQIQKTGLDIKITESKNYDLFSVADLALATSGTVTLEAAVLGLGSVICYRTGWFNALIARLVLNVSYIGLPNIVAGREVLPELLQENFTAEKVAQEAEKLLEPERFKQMKNDLEFVKKRLGKTGAVHRVAELILQTAGAKA